MPLRTESNARKPQSGSRRQLPREFTEQAFPPPTSSPEQADPKAAQRKPGVWFLFFGVVVPLLAVLFEWQTHFCARHFFDPLPSNLHIFLVGLIPLSNALIWLSVRRDLSSFYAPITLLAGMAMGIAFMYSVMFLPVVPLSLMWVLALGFGLLGLSPAIAMFCLWRGGGVISQTVSSFGTFFDPHQVKHLGHLVVLITVLVVEFPSTITRIYLQMASKPETTTQGIQMLRKLGSQEVMLRACYERSGRATDILGSLCEFSHPLKVEEARDIFYKVTGRAFNSVPIPSSARATIQHAGVGVDYGDLNAGVEDEFDLDTDIAGEVVSSFARGLSLNESTLAGTIDPDAALAKLDWTINFRNSSAIDREERAKILLPHGAVVTGACVWINGEKREAEIHVRQQARAEYVASVHQRSGPLLVSMCGPDSVLVQCYPVPGSGNLKVHLDIAAPLGLDRNQDGVLSLPSFEERNFQVDAPTRLDFLSSKPLNLGGGQLKSSSVGATKYRLSGEVKNSDLSKTAAILYASRDRQIAGGWCPDEFNRDGSAVESRVVQSDAITPKQLTVLIDGSVSTGPFMAEIKDSLGSLPADLPTEIIFVSDDIRHLCEPGTRPSDGPFQQAIGQLGSDRCAGGQDNIRPLADCLTLHRQESGRAVLWIHGAQPQASPGLNGVNSILSDNSSSGPILYDMQVTSGPNVALNGIYRSNHLSRVPRAGSVADDLRYLFESWSHRVKPAVLVMSRHASGEWVQTIRIRTCSRAGGNPADFSLSLIDKSGATIEQGGMASTSGPVAQLWAYDQILRHQIPDQGDEVQSTLAARYHIVSPVSSAVAIEPKPKPMPAARPVPMGFPLRGMGAAVRDKLQTLKDAVDLKAKISGVFRATSSQLNQLAAYPPAQLDSLSSEYQGSRESSAPAAGGSANLQMKERRQEEAEQKPDNNAPMLQGATNGTIGPQAGDATVVDEVNTAGTVKEDSLANTSIVPEADTWLLVGAAALLFGALVLRSRLKARRV